MEYVSRADFLLAERLKLKKKNGKMSTIDPIDDDTNLYYNSINIAVGKQGSGKTLLFLRELINISLLEEEYKNTNPIGFHLIIYVTQSGEINDETFKSLQDLISIPVFNINYNVSEEVINGLLDYKQEYYKFIDNPDILGTWDEEKIVAISEALNIDLRDKKKKFPKTLHTIIYFEDAANQSVFKHNDSYFNKLAFQCRHNNTIFLFCVQKLQGISKPILSQATGFFIYPGFSPQELSYINRMSSISGLNYQELKALYAALKQYQLLSVNTVKQSFEIVDLSHINKLVNTKNNRKIRL